MSESSKAVFLSYARDDAAAARRIADALRSVGLEVWFDENELRGGDAWDQKIRRQIKECALFVPVVSAHTEARGEGYFRLEWKLAVERTHLMAEGVPFLAPVAIDTTTDADAVAPAEFLRVQWMRLPGALPTPQFVEQVKRLLESPRKAARPVVAGVADPGPASPRPAASSKWNQRLPLIVTVLAIGVALFFAFRPSRPAATPAPAVATKERPAPLPPVNDKSIAVLPFENRSDDKGNAVFTDGIHEDILTNLAHIAALRVVSRTSVMEYRGTTKKIRQIGQELGVAWLLEGSVERVGNKVRVTGQLINARTDQHVWAQSYDRDLTDIFAIQAELAQQIAAALSATLSPQEKVELGRRSSTNLAANDLYHRALAIEVNGNDTREEKDAETALLDEAVKLDPGFAEAWSLLAAAHAQLRFGFTDPSPARLAKAQAAIDAAVRLAPDAPDVITGLGNFFYYGSRDYPRASEQFERFQRQWPNNYVGPFCIALVQRRQGKWPESLANLRRAEELDPRSPDIARNLLISFRAMRRYDEAIAEQARRVQLLPESLREAYELARLHFLAHGSTREADELLAGPIAERAGPAVAAGYRKLWAATKGDLATALRLDREFPNEWGETIGTGGIFRPWAHVVVRAAAGDLSGARADAGSAVATLHDQLAAVPENPIKLINLALMESLLGHQAEALTAAHQSLALMSESTDSLVGAGMRTGLATALAWTGDKEAACAELRRLLAEPGGPNIHELKNAPWFTPLKGYPAFEQILADPKNNAPLY
jgi:TolB-like protein